jgi:hypothetical protein
VNETASLLFSVTFVEGTDAALWEQNVSATLPYPLATAASYSAANRRISRRGFGRGGAGSGNRGKAAAMYVPPA